MWEHDGSTFFILFYDPCSILTGLFFHCLLTWNLFIVKRMCNSCLSYSHAQIFILPYFINIKLKANTALLISYCRKSLNLHYIRNCFILTVTLNSDYGRHYFLWFKLHYGVLYYRPTIHATEGLFEKLLISVWVCGSSLLFLDL